MIYYYSESLLTSNIEDCDYSFILFLLSQKILLSYISIYVEKRKKVTLLVLGEFLWFLVINKKEREIKKEERSFP